LSTGHAGFDEFASEMIAVAQEKIGGAIVDEEEELTDEAEEMIDKLFEAPPEEGELECSTP